MGLARAVDRPTNRMGFPGVCERVVIERWVERVGLSGELSVCEKVS